MKILHCADLHLDSSLRTHFSPGLASIRRRELLQTFADMIAYAEQEQAEAVLIAGDLFDVPSVSAEASRIFLDQIRSHPSIRFFYLRGNHDPVCFLSKTLPENLILFDGKWKTLQLDRETAPPHIRLSGAECGLQDPCALADSLQLTPSDLNIVMLHGQLVPSVHSDVSDAIPLPLYKGKHIDYMALGHIHSFRKEPLDSRGIFCYPGCLEGRGFDETGSHGFVMLQIDTVSCSGGDPSGSRHAFQLSAEFIPFARRTLHCIPLDVSSCRTSRDILSLAGSTLDSLTLPSEDMLRIILTGESDAEWNILCPFLENALSGKYFYLDIIDQTVPAVHYEEYLHSVSLKGEFVRAVMKDPSLSDTERAAVIRCGLAALRGEKPSFSEAALFPAARNTFRSSDSFCGDCL